MTDEERDELQKKILSYLETEQRRRAEAFRRYKNNLDLEEDMLYRAKQHFEQAREAYAAQTGELKEQILHNQKIRKETNRQVKRAKRVITASPFIIFFSVSVGELIVEKDFWGWLLNTFLSLLQGN